MFDNGYAVDWSALNWTDPAASVGLANRSYSQVLEIDPLTSRDSVQVHRYVLGVSHRIPHDGHGGWGPDDFPAATP